MNRACAAHVTFPLITGMWRAAPDVLSDEYRQGLHDSRAELEALEARAQTWRAGGPAVLAACADWLAVELDILAARVIIEQQEPPGDRRRLLHRERQRLDEASAGFTGNCRPGPRR
jgi:hypothetical protein